VGLLIAIIVVLAMSLLAAVTSAEEAATALVSPGRVQRLVESEQQGSAQLEKLTEQAYQFRAAAALVSAVAYCVAATASMWAAIGLVGEAPIWVTGAAGGLVAIVVVYSLGHALPRTVAVQNPEGVALTFARASLQLTRVFYPLSRVLSALWRWSVRLITGRPDAIPPWVTEDEYRIHTTDSEDPERDAFEEVLFDSISAFTEKVVREVMVPRTDMTCLPDTATAAEAIELIDEAGYSRLPVYHETLDDIRGVIYAKDLLAAVVDPEEVRPSRIARRAYFVPETKPVRELLFEMRSKTHIAIVADEYGGTSGLVTIEDLLEEIVGEIFDEYDSAIPLVVPLDGIRYRVDARIPVDEVNERFGTAVDMDADTLGGVVSELMGRIPVVGDAVEIEGLRIIVDELEGNRVRQLVVEPSASNGTKEGHDAQSDTA
jgi:CBS domain containing-hemolysin-like protein